VLAERPGGALRNAAAAKALLRWAAAEREAWLEAVTNDPLLPGRMLPSDYLGQPAWRFEMRNLASAIKRSVEPDGNCTRSTSRNPGHVRCMKPFPNVVFPLGGSCARLAPCTVSVPD